ncbi:hypothetical protein JKP88DRAFT_245202 [Tribonema minus]|uniref:PDZ domain-containing protein n=1 Tax=Tribonema minus TaxID=303371 RepID=A0A836CEJ5_9STRA|nr:hypothetical protein JKP88DRAFT_245202 [Tribonema minus]
MAPKIPRPLTLASIPSSTPISSFSTVCGICSRCVKYNLHSTPTLMPKITIPSAWQQAQQADFAAANSINDTAAPALTVRELQSISLSGGTNRGTSKLRVGDVLIAVNDTSLQGLDFEAAVAAVSNSNSSEERVLTFLRPHQNQRRDSRPASAPQENAAAYAAGVGGIVLGDQQHQSGTDRLSRTLDVLDVAGAKKRKRNRGLARQLSATSKQGLGGDSAQSGNALPGNVLAEQFAALRLQKQRLETERREEKERAEREQRALIEAQAPWKHPLLDKLESSLGDSAALRPLAVRSAAAAAADREAKKRDTCWSDLIGPKPANRTPQDVPRSHFRVLVVSTEFQGRQQLQRLGMVHDAITAALAPEVPDTAPLQRLRGFSWVGRNVAALPHLSTRPLAIGLSEHICMLMQGANRLNAHCRILHQPSQPAVTDRNVLGPLL